MALRGTNTVNANPATGATDSVILAAVAGKQINVLALVAVASTAAGGVTFNSNGAGAGTPISATFALGINGVLCIPDAVPGGWFTTNAGEGLTVTTTGTTPIGITVVYELY